MTDKLGLQLNGYETVRSPLVGSGTCLCCICCTNTRPEYYVMRDGTLWLVSTDGTIGVLIPGSGAFEVKYHARHYHSWRLGSNSDYMMHPVSPPDVRNLGFNGAVRFPYHRDVIGFQVDVDKCVIFNAHGTLLYEGYYDGRRYPLFYNGHDRTVFTADHFEYRTAAIRFPVVNTKTSDRWGPADKIRFIAEDGESAYPVLDRLGIGFAGVAWLTRREPEPQLDNKLCGYEAHGAHAWYSTYRDYACERPKDNDPPLGEIFEESNPVVLPRDRVRKRVCVPPELTAPGHTVAQRTCEEVDIVRYHRCLMDFVPDTPLEHQIQGFDLNICGNFVRVILRNNRVSNNKWYRYVGNIESAAALPKYLPKKFTLEELFPDGYQEIPQDDWGIPRWWSQYLQTFYVYGSHSRAKYQWMRFADQRRADIKNVQWLEVADTLADDRRKEENAEKEVDQQTPEYCPLVSGAERILARTAHGFLPESPFSEWDPYNPDSYGILQFDVMSVGREGSPDGRKRWYYFDGLDWIQGEGSYQDLKNYSNEDLNIIFYKGQENLNMCEPDAHIIPANADRIQCCGDFLIIGLGTNYETRLIFEKDRKLHDFAINGIPEPEQYEKESFVCCDSFFGFTVLELTNRVRSFFYDLEVDDDGTVLRSTRIWQGYFSLEEAPQFTGGCVSDCRYYFARQTDKKGIYFYRDATDKGRAGIEYGRWKILKELDIKNDTNIAPSSGCASTSAWCSIPCEGENDRTGSQRYFNGEVFSGSCEPYQPSYTEEHPIVIDEICEGPARCSNGWGGWTQEITAAHVNLTVTRYDHYSNVGDQEPCWHPANTFRMTGQSVGNGRGSVESRHVIVMDGVTTTSGVSHDTGDSTISSSIRVGGQYATHLGAFECFGSGVHLSHTTITNGVGGETGEEVNISYQVEQCENILRLRRLTDMKIVDEVAIPIIVDYEGLPELPGMGWSLIRTEDHGGWYPTVCTICSGEIEPGFTLPGRSYHQVNNVYGDSTSMTLGIVGREEDAVCSQYSLVNSYVGSLAGPIPPNDYYKIKRLSGKIYYADPYQEKILSIDTGLAGTFVSGRTSPTSCFNTAGAGGGVSGGYSTCILGNYYQVFLIDGEPNRAVLLQPPRLDPVERRVVYEVLEYSGQVDGPEGLFMNAAIHTGAVRPDPYICQTTPLGWCSPQASCSSGGQYTAIATGKAGEGGSGHVVVDVKWQNRVYRFSVDGYTRETRLSLRCCAPYIIVFLDDVGYLHYITQLLDTVSPSWHLSGCCGKAAILRNEETGFQRVFIEGEEIDTSDIFQGNPYHSTVSNEEYRLSVQCCDDYYLFSHHSENDVEFANEYTPDVKSYQVKGGAGWTGIPDIDEWLNEWLGSPNEDDDKPEADECLEQWESNNNATMILLDGTVCKAVKGHVRKTDDKSVAVGPARWRTIGVARPPVFDDQGNIKYPAVGEYEFDDPLCPWWEGGTGFSYSEIRADDTRGVLSLMKTLLGSNADMSDRRYADVEDQYKTNNTWLFGFRLKHGKNIAAAYYKTTFLYNDSRLQDVKCFCERAFGVFTFTGAGYYWWDTPLIRRKHRHEERKGTNALGNPTYTVYESQFDLYQGLPNLLPHKQLDHEIPPNTEDMTALGDWLQKYVPYGAYVFNRTEQISSSLDTEMSDDVEPPSNTEHAGVKPRGDNPPYNAGYSDPKHPYGDFLYFNDRHAPVRYDRALSWSKPFEDHCDHRDFRFGESLDLIRSPFTEGGERVVVGGNGVLHVFDDQLGRMDFNAETLEKIQ